MRRIEYLHWDGKEFTWQRAKLTAHIFDTNRDAREYGAIYEDKGWSHDVRPAPKGGWFVRRVSTL